MIDDKSQKCATVNKIYEKLAVRPSKSSSFNKLTNLVPKCPISINGAQEFVVWSTLTTLLLSTFSSSRLSLAFVLWTLQGAYSSVLHALVVSKS